MCKSGILTNKISCICQCCYSTKTKKVATAMQVKLRVATTDYDFFQCRNDNARMMSIGVLGGDKDEDDDDGGD